MYRPSLPFNVPAQILKTNFKKVNGVEMKEITDGDYIYVSAKSYGGTEQVVNDVYSVVDTMIIETWYRPDITSADRIKIQLDGSIWEILNTPENIDMRNQFLKMKCRRVKGNG